MIHVQHDKAGHGYVLTKAKVYVCKCIAEAIIAIGLIASLVFLSIARDNAMGRADAMQAAAEEHKANEERLVNELTAAIEQKTDIENALLEEKMQKAELKPEIVEIEVIKEVEVPAQAWEYDYTQEDIDILAAVMYGEEYPNRYEMGLAGSVVLNRVKDPEYPNTIKDVVYQIDGPYEQYAPRTKGFIGKELPEECYRLAEILLKYGPIAPSNVKYQAHFNQGDVFWEWEGEEFCFGR